MYVKKYGQFPDRIILQDGIEHQLPEPPPKLSMVRNSRLGISNQKWRRDELPDFMRPNVIVEGIEKHKDVQWFLDPDVAPSYYEEYIKEQWKLRREGMWMYIHGNPVYITGIHWFYLQWYSLGAVYPDYRDRDRRWWLMWDWTVKTDGVYGMIYPKNRGDGASFRGGCMLLEYGTGHEQAYCAFQNKVGKQAEGKFNEIVTKPFMKLPAHFLPISKGSTENKDGLYLMSPERKLTHKTSIYEIQAQLLTGDGEAKALNSQIRWGTTKSNYFDGETLHRKFDDEIGKWVEDDYADCLNVNLLCFRDPTQEGKLLACSTSPGENEKEDSNKGLAKAMQTFKGICYDSLWNNKDEKTGMRRSECVTYFVPANDGMLFKKQSFFDEYGNSKILEADDFLNKKITTALGSNNVHESIYLRRQFPRTLEECFIENTDSAPWNVENILRLEYELTGMDFTGFPKIDKYCYRANLHWDEYRKSVKIMKSPSGRFVISTLLDNILLAGENPLMKLNDIHMEGANPVPMNKLPILIGIDPFTYKHDDLSGSSKYHSKCAALAWLSHYDKLDGPEPSPEEQANNPFWAKNTKSNSFIMQYYFRSNDPDEQVDDIFKMCVLLGRQAMIEVNANSFKAIFERSGAHRFVKTSYGVLTAGQSEIFGKGRSGHFTDSKTHEAGTSWWAGVYQDHAYAHKIPFLDVIDEGKRFDLSKATHFDLHMAGMMISVWENELKSRKRIQEAKAIVGTRHHQPLQWSKR